MGKIYFITFGAGDINYFEAVSRICEQAKQLNIFDKIIGYTTIYLVNDKEFWKSHGEFIKNNKRGFGYWLWKPYLIKKTLELLDDGDILVYLDCGCEIDVRNKDKILELFEIVKTDKIIGSFVKKSKESMWTKKDLFIELGALKSKYVYSEQRQATGLVLLKCKEVVDLVNLWYKVGSNYHLIDDSPSKEKNFDIFKEHRHDQSIFSLLTKKYNIYSTHSISPSIYLSRNRSGTSKIY
jgi:hypothetical protein